MSRLPENQAGLEAGLDVHRFRLTSRWRIGAMLIVPVKRVLRRLMYQVLARQAEFNAAATHELDRLGSEVAALCDEQERSIDDLSEVTQELKRTVEALDQRAEPSISLELPLDRFRGDREVIKERQRMYIDFFAGQQNVVDLGCGRGEFLELLREAGIAARGVDLDRELVAACAARKLSAERGDALSYLAGVLPGSLGGVFAAQLIEHLPVGEVARLVALASTRLRPGGTLVLETVNPLCFSSLARFWLDPTHVRPLYPELMQWLAEREGFVEVEIFRSAPVDSSIPVPPLEGVKDAGDLAEFNAGIARLNWEMYGPQDFALIARRPQ
jgi:SAM-dependent methyltransferase